MMHPALIPPALMSLMLSAGAVQAFPCTFATQCVESRACGTSALEIDVDIGGKVIDTHSGLITIVAVKEDSDLKTLFATGLGSEYLLSLTPELARFSVHENDGPTVTTYLGLCKEAF